MLNFNHKFILSNKPFFLKFSFKRNFDQYLIRPKRHFVLNYKYKPETENLIQSNYSAHMKLIESYERSSIIILGAQFTDNQGESFIFQGNDETVPDEFIKKDPYYNNGVIADYEINEIELIPRKRYDELQVLYKYR